MTIRIINGTTEFEGVPYYAGTDQCEITGIDDGDGQKLVDLGYAIRIPDPPKPPIALFQESPEKIRGKISELEAKLAEAEKEQEALLDDNLEDVAGVMRKAETANSKAATLKQLIERQNAKLERAEKNAALEREKNAVKNLEKTAGECRKEAEKILNGILADVAALEAKAAALDGLRGRVRTSYQANMDGIWKTCPMLEALGLPPEFGRELDGVKSRVNRDLSLLETLTARTPEELRNYFNSRRHKTREQLLAEIQEREREEYRRREREKLGLTA